ncbi:MAG: hypothetical protein PUF95_01930 [Selenomonadaceae bacterium]|nr:hypothetical protein [Selenomonadaceae bacterium]
MAFGALAGLIFSWLFRKDRKYMIVYLALMGIILDRLHAVLVFLGMDKLFQAKGVSMII